MLILAASLIGGLCNYLYQSIMGRALGPADYSELASLISIYTMLTIPSTIIGLTMLRNVSRLKVEGRHEEIAWLIRRNGIICLGVGVAMTVAVLLLSPILSDFLDISHEDLLLLLAVGAFLTMVGTPVNSTTQALERFRYYALFNLANPLVKLLLGIILVGVGYGVAGAFGAVILGTIAALFILYIGMRDYLRMERRPTIVGDQWFYTGAVALSTISFLIITNVDTFLARGYLPPEEAGLYSACSTLGKMLLLLTSAITTVALPRLTESKARSLDPSALMRQALLYSVVILGAITAFCFLFPEFVLRFVYGSEYLDAVDVLPVVVLAFALLALTAVYRTYGLAREVWSLIVTMAVFTVVAVGLMVLFHDSPMQIALALLAASASIAVISFIIVEMKHREMRRASPRPGGQVEGRGSVSRSR